jgi:hypothetical protein
VGQLIPLACAGDVTQPRIRAKARIFQRRDGPRYVRTRFGCFDDCDQAPAVEATVEGQPVESGDLVPISGDGRVDVQCTDLAGNRSDLSFLPWQP